MKEKWLSLPLVWLLIIGIATAEIILWGSVIAEILIPKEISIGEIMVNEEVEYTLATINQTISTSFNLSTTCLFSEQEGIKMTVTKPVGSTAPSTVEVLINDSTILNEDGNVLEMGNLTLKLRGMSQTVFNCSIVPEVENVTQIIWKESL